MIAPDTLRILWRCRTCPAIEVVKAPRADFEAVLATPEGAAPALLPVPGDGGVADYEWAPHIPKWTCSECLAKSAAREGGSS